MKVLVLGILALAAVAHLTQTPSSHLGLASGLITLAFIVGIVVSIEVGLMTLALELGPRIAVSGIWDPFICSKELENQLIVDLSICIVRKFAKILQDYILKG